MQGNPIEMIRSMPEGVLWGVFTGGVLLAGGSLAYGEWQAKRLLRKERKYAGNLGYRFGKMRRKVAKLQQRLYSIQEIRNALPRLIKDEVEGLNLEIEVEEELYRRLAFRLNCWELHPQPKPKPVPDPVYVKQQIIERLNNGIYRVRVQLPDVTSSTRTRVETLFAKLGRRS